MGKDGQTPQGPHGENIQRADYIHRGDATAYVLQHQNVSLSSSHHQTSQENSHLNYFDASLFSRLDLPSYFPNFDRASILSSTPKRHYSVPRNSHSSRVAGKTMLLNIYEMTHGKTMRHLVYTQVSNLPQCDPERKQLQDLYLIVRMLRLVKQ